MRHQYFTCFLLTLLTACAGSKEAALKSQAQEEIAAIAPVIGLREDQTAPMIAIQTDYLRGKQQLKPASADTVALRELADRRKAALKNLLTPQQLLKWQLLNRQQMNKNHPPIRVK